MYCEHIDNDTKQIFGLTSKQYDGYVEVNDIEQAYNGDWYVKGYAPQKPEEVIKQERIAELKQLLADSDYWTSKYCDGEYTDEEWTEKVAQRKAWREEIRRLEDESIVD